jgi:hypothetical protein
VLLNSSLNDYEVDSHQISIIFQVDRKYPNINIQWWTIQIGTEKWREDSKGMPVKQPCPCGKRTDTKQKSRCL